MELAINTNPAMTARTKKTIFKNAFCMVVTMGLDTRCRMLDLVPTNVGNLKCPVREASDISRDHIKSWVTSSLLALGKEKLKPEAKSKKRNSPLNRRDDRLYESELLKVVPGVRKGPNPREDELGGLPDRLGVLRHMGGRPHRLEGLRHTPQVPHPIINDGNHENSDLRHKTKDRRPSGMI